MFKKILLAVLIAIVVPVLAHADWITAESGYLPSAYHSKFVVAQGHSSLDEVLIPDETWELAEIRFRLLSAADGVFNVKLLSARPTLGSQSSTNQPNSILIVSQDMSSTADYIATFAPGEMVFRRSDSLQFTWSSGLSAIYGLEVRYRTPGAP